METALFLGMVGFFAAHELDAMSRHEWRILPLTSFLPDSTGRAVFLWLHVPVFAGVALIAAAGAQSGAAFGLSVFAVVHVGLHWLYRNHPANEFGNLGSQALIRGAGVFGALHVAVRLFG